MLKTWKLELVEDSLQLLELTQQLLLLTCTYPNLKLKMVMEEPFTGSILKRQI